MKARRLLQLDAQIDRFEDLFFPVMDRLYSYAFGLTQDRWDAEDLVQDTYLKAWRSFNTFNLGTNFNAWIYRILTNCFITQFNSRKRLPRYENVDTACANHPMQDYSEAADGIEMPVTGYGDLFDDDITAALDRLPMHYRMVVLLSVVENLKYEEIARVLGCPVGTVMSRLSRARKLLARGLRTYAAANGYKKMALAGPV